jgi:hypothetical protein
MCDTCKLNLLVANLLAERDEPELTIMGALMVAHNDPLVDRNERDRIDRLVCEEATTNQLAATIKLIEAIKADMEGMERMLTIALVDRSGGDTGLMDGGDYRALTVVPDGKGGLLNAVTREPVTDLPEEIVQEMRDRGLLPKARAEEIGDALDEMFRGKQPRPRPLES